MSGEFIYFKKKCIVECLPLAQSKPQPRNDVAGSKPDTSGLKVSVRALFCFSLFFFLHGYFAFPKIPLLHVTRSNFQLHFSPPLLFLAPDRANTLFSEPSFAFSLVHGAPEAPGSESLPAEGAEAEARRGTARRGADLGGAAHRRRASGAPLRRCRTGEHPRVDFHVERSGSIRGQTRHSRASRSREEW